MFGLPLYLILNASGQKHFGHVDHYNPGSKIFKSRDFWDIVWSDIGIASVIGTMVYWANVRSWQEMVAMVCPACCPFLVFRAACSVLIPSFFVSFRSRLCSG